MRRRIFALLICGTLLYQTSSAFAILGVGDIVFDPAAVAQIIESIERLETLINRIRDVQKLIKKWEEIDHINLAGGKFGEFLSQYRTLFNEIFDEIGSYQSGGLLGQVGRLDEVYFPYHGDWEKYEKAFESDPRLREVRKQLLWTKIQFKHAAKVAAKVRDSLPETQTQIETLLDDTAQAQGIMQSIKIGNELVGMVAKSAQTLNVSLTELIQAQAGEGLEKNMKGGMLHTRSCQAIEGFGEDANNDRPVPLNPISE